MCRSSPNADQCASPCSPHELAHIKRTPGRRAPAPRRSGDLTMTGFFNRRRRRGSGTLSVVGDIAAQAGKLGIEICDVSGHIEEVATRVERQANVCQTLRQSAAATLTGNHRIAAAAREMRTVTAQAAGDVETSQQTLEASLSDIHGL